MIVLICFLQCLDVLIRRAAETDQRGLTGELPGDTDRQQAGSSPARDITG